MEDVLQLYNLLIQANPQVERKGKTMPYTSINGHMFSFLSKEGKMGLRLSTNDRIAFMESYEAKLMIQHGRTMKEYVEVPSNMLQETDKLSAYLQKSLTYVSSLKPKPTKNKS
jgi:TfoX/Sxy family transcriptional regulator of competence genes